MVILGCYFAEDGTELFSSVCRTCSTLIVLYSTTQILKYGVIRAVLVVDDKDSHYGTGDDFRKCDFPTLIITNRSKKPFPSSPQPPFQSEAKCEVFVMKISFHSY